jgi:CHAT domain-containing protein/tetratricopeptide (TPR) repeat protein
MIRCAVILVLLLSACTQRDARIEAEAAYADGRPAEAVVLYQAALEDAPAEQRAHIRARMGLAQGKAGQVPAAIATLNEVIAHADTPPLVRGRAQRYLAQIHARQSQLEQAEALFTAAARTFEAHHAHDDLIRVSLGLAGLQWRRGALDDTYQTYLDVHGRALVADDARSQGAALQGMAMVLSYAGDHAAARMLVFQACELLDAVGEAGAALACRVQATVMRVGADEPERAAGEAHALFTQAESKGATAVAAQAAVVYAWALSRLERWPEARTAAHTAQARSEGSDQPRLAYEARLVALLAQTGAQDWAGFEAEAEAIHALLPPTAPGQALLSRARADHAVATGHSEHAAKHLQDAVRSLEAQRSATDSTLQTAFLLPERARIYERLLIRRIATGQIDAALALVSAMKARAWTDRLQGGLPITAQGLPSADRISQSLARFRLGQRTQPAADPAQIRAALPADLVLVEYAVLPEQVLAFVRRHGHPPQVFHSRIAQDTLRQRVHQAVHTLRDGGAWQADARWLSGHLLEPIRAALSDLRQAGLKRLVVIPHRSLHALPFEVLPWGDALLVDRLPVFSVPSASALVHLLASPTPKPARSVLTIADARNNLPGARIEAARIARFFTRPQRLIGSSAGRAAVRAALPTTDVVHFAVHGVRPTADAPAYLELHDGALRAHEIATAELSAPLVVLSVCDSARGTPNGGDEVVGVLDRAFLEAGARAVIASRWPVHDAASVLFMEHLYQGLEQNKSLLDAFYGAQMALRHKQVGPKSLQPELLALLDGSRVRGVRPFKSSTPITAFDHPYFWAAFSLRGDPR